MNNSIQQQQSDIIWSAGRINQTSSLYMIPHYLGEVRTQIPANTSVAVFGRDRQLKWLNVGYKNSVGQIVHGWVHANKLVDHTSQQGTPAQMIDIPITQYQFNSRDEVKILAKLCEDVTYGKQYEGMEQFIEIVLWLGVIGVSIFALISSAWILFVVAIGMVVWALSLSSTASNRAEQSHASDADYLSKEDRKKRLEDVQNYLKASKPAGERMAELAKLAGAGAVLLGGAVAAGKVYGAHQDRQHQSNLANKGGYNRIDIHRKR